MFLSVPKYHEWLKEFIKDNQSKEGLNLEFGVADGNSLHKLVSSEMNKFYGFDSFKGLPEDWIPEYEEGTFARTGLPEVPDNVELIAGWFDNSLPEFIKREDINCKKADFIHIDCDLYTSTKTVFEYIGKFIKKGTIIAFDEYFNFPGWQFDEYRAFQEFAERNDIAYSYLAYVERATQVCIRIL